MYLAMRDALIKLSEMPSTAENKNTFPVVAGVQTKCPEAGNLPPSMGTRSEGSPATDINIPDKN